MKKATRDNIIIDLGGKAEDLRTMEGMSEDLLISLAAKGIKTMED